jgi:hypothetical protein
MNTYSVTVEDIYDKSREKKFQVRERNAILAHKASLSNTNALREEITKIISSGKLVYSMKDGFSEN